MPITTHCPKLGLTSFVRSICVLLFLLASSNVYAQINLNATAPSGLFCPSITSIDAGTKFYRVHVWRNDGSGSVAANQLLVDFEHSPGTGSVIDNNVGFRRMLLGIGTVSEAAWSCSGYDPYINPFGSSGPLASVPFDVYQPTPAGGCTNFGLCSWVAPNSIPAGSPIDFHDQTSGLSPAVLGPGEYVYIVEEFETSPCPTTIAPYTSLTALASASNISIYFKFTSPTNDMCTGTFCDDSNSGDITVKKNVRPIVSITYGDNPLSGFPVKVNALAGPQNCSGNTAGRSYTYRLVPTSGPLVDPKFNFFFSEGNRPVHFEVNPDSIRISMSLVIGSPSAAPVIVNNIKLSELQNAMNVFDVGTYDDPIIANASPLSAASSGDCKPLGVVNDHLLKTPNTLLLKQSLDGVVGHDIFHSLSLNLSNLYIERNALPVLDTRTLNCTAQTGHLVIYAGSEIRLDYVGTFVGHNEFGDGTNSTLDFSAYKTMLPALSSERWHVLGYDQCGGNFSRIRGNSDQSHWFSADPRFPFAAASNHSMAGTSDRDELTWDGEVEQLRITLPALNGLVGLNHNGYNQTMDPLDVNYQASTMEFVIELPPGLTIPCPNTPNVVSITGIGDPTTTNHTNTNCASAVAFGANAAYTYLDGPSSLPCGDAASAFGAAVDPHEVFRIEIANGDLIFADAIHIEPITAGNCAGGQRWRVQVPMNRFWGALDAAGTDDIWLLQNARMLVNVQAYCPAPELPQSYSVYAIVIPNYCSSPQTETLANGYPNSSRFHYDCTPDVANACSPQPPNLNVVPSTPYVPGNNCFLVGAISGVVKITCPGCLTPGVAVTPGTTLRHADFVGWADADDDGVADGTMPRAAHPDSINRQLIRHGDVMTMNFQSYLYDPAPNIHPNDDDPSGPAPLCLNGPGDEFSSSHLANPSATNGYGNGTPLLLDTWVYEISFSVSSHQGTPSGQPNSFKGRDVFHPLVQNANGNEARLFRADEEMTLAEYQSLAANYRSSVTVEYYGLAAPVSVTFDLEATDILWTTDEQLRIALDIQRVVSAFSVIGITVPETYFEGNTQWFFTYNMQFITDVEKNAYQGHFLQQAGNTTSLNAETRHIGIDHFMYVTDADAISLLDPTLPVLVLSDHPSEWEEAIGVDCAGAAIAPAPSSTWWCEANDSEIWLAAHHVARYTHNRSNPNTGVYEATVKGLITEADGLSPCIETGPFIEYRAGARGARSPNHFRGEIRPSELADSLIFYVPKPFIPEAIVIRNLCNFNTGFGGYIGNVEVKNYNIVIPLQGVNGLFSDPTYISTTDAANLGISVTDGWEMPADFYPRYPSGTANTYNIIDATGNLVAATDNALVINDPGTGSRVEHWRIAINLEYMHKYPASLTGVPSNLGTGNNTVHYTTSNPIFSGWTGGAVPMIIGDEYQRIHATVMYTIPGCNNNGQSAANGTAYTENCDFRAENNSFHYYNGDHLDFLRQPYNGGLTRVEVVHNPNALTLGNTTQFPTNPRFHPSFNDFNLMLPSSVKTHPLRFGSSPTLTSISMNQTAVNNHVLSFASTATENLMNGVVPATGSGVGGIINAFQAFGYIFFDQRADYKVVDAATTRLNVNSASNKFNFSFKLKDEQPEQITSIMAPCELQDQITDVDVDLGTNYWRNESQWIRHRTDLNGLYFYLKPKPFLIGTTTYIFPMDQVKVTKIEGTSFGSGVFAATEVSLGVYEPNLFALSNLGLLSEKNYNIECEFLCDDPQVLAWLDGGGTSLEFPFDIVVNYDCSRDVHPYDPSKTNNPGEVLDATTAFQTRCSNDRSSGEYSIDPLTLEYSITLEETTGSTACNPQFAVKATNGSDGSISITAFQNLQVSIGGVPVNHTVAFTGGSPSGSAVVTVGTITLQGPCVDGVLDIQLDALAQAYCVSCDPQDPTNCTLLSRHGDLLQPYSTTLITGSSTTTDATCNNADGSASLTLSGGCGALIPTWPDGSNAINRNDLAAGTYTISITDGNGCTSTLDVVVGAISSSSITTYASAAVCSPNTYDLNTAILSTSPSGGTLSFFDSNGPVADPTNVSADGTYTISYDVAGCVASSTVAVSFNPTPVVPFINGNIPICEGDDLILTATPGTPGATYHWTSTSANGNTTSQSSSTYDDITTITENDEGVYTLIVELNGCFSAPNTRDVIVNPIPAAPMASYNAPLCEGEDLDLSASTIPGASTYQWSDQNGFLANAQNYSIQNAMVAHAGVYNVRVNVDGCWSALSPINVTINATPNLVINDPAPVCAPGCVDLTDPAITAGSDNGMFYYFDASGNSVADPTCVLVSGTYSIELEANGCVVVAPVSVTINPTPILPTVTSNSPVCAGGTLNLTASSDPGATYFWTHPNGFASTVQNPVISPATISNPNTYTVTATLNGCTSQTSINVDVLEVPGIELNAGCVEGNNYQINVDVFGGSGPYVYHISPAVQGAPFTSNNPNFTFTGLSSGTTYTVYVTANGCASGSQTITTPSAPLQVTVPLAQGPSCAPLTDGTIKIAVSGGVPPYSITWTGPAGPIVGIPPTFIDQLDVGDYDLIVVDAWGCEVAMRIRLDYRETLTMNLIGNTVGCESSTAGQLEVTLGGTLQGGTFDYILNPNPAQQVPSNPFTITGLVGQQNITVYNQAGCSVSGSYFINTSAFTVTGTTVQPLCFGDLAGVDLNIQGGNPPYTVDVPLSSNSNTPPPATFNTTGVHGYYGFEGGSYLIRIVDAGGCRQSYNLFIDQVSQMSLADLQVIRCKGNPKKIVSLYGGVVGGTPPYVVNITNAGVNQFMVPGLDGVFSFDNLAVQGPTTITVVDANQCSFTQSIALSPVAQGLNPNIGGNSFSTAATCGASDGEIHIGYAGQYNGISYPWRFTIDGVNWQASSHFYGLAPGTYHVQMGYELFVNGFPAIGPCLDEIDITVYENTIGISISKVKHSKAGCGFNPECFPDATPGFHQGEIVLQFGGGQPQPNYTIFWYKNGVQQTAVTTSNTSYTFAGLSPAIYKFQVSDGTLCLSDPIQQIIGSNVAFSPYSQASPGGISFSVQSDPCHCSGYTYGVNIYQVASNGGLVHAAGQFNIFASNPPVLHFAALPPGIYVVVTEDCNGCLHVSTVKLKGKDNLEGTPTPLVDETVLANISAQLFPNPTGNEAYLSYDLKSDKSEATLHVMDQTGKLIHTEILTTSSGKIKLPTHQLESGVYIVRLTTENGNAWVDKLIVLK